MSADDGTRKEKLSLWSAPNFAAALSAILLLLAFAPAKLFLLVLVALAPWMASLILSKGVGGGKSGVAFGVVYGLGQFVFLPILTERWTGSWLLAAAPWIAAGLLWTSYYTLAGWLLGRACARGIPWLMPVIWVGVEGLISSVPAFQFPWGLLATPLAAAPELIQGASVGTILFVSGWAALVNLMVAFILLGFNPRVPLRYGLAAMGLALLSLVRYSVPPSFDNQLVVVVGQPGVDVAFDEREIARARLWTAIGRAASIAVAADADLLVLPEGVALAEDGEVPDSAMGAHPPLPVVLGGQRHSGAAAYQSAFAFDGVRWASIDKSRLIIFGEYVPLRDQLPFLNAFRLVPTDLKAGTGPRPLSVGRVVVGPVLCFEALFSDVAATQARRGAQMLAVLSVDDWFFGSPAVDQLALATIWRAVETGLPAVRAATQGTSMAVDARGNVVAKAPLGKFVPMRVELAIPGRADGFRFAWLFPLLCELVAGWVAISSLLNRAKARTA